MAKKTEKSLEILRTEFRQNAPKNISAPVKGLKLKGSKGAELSGGSFPAACEVHGEKFKEFAADSGTECFLFPLHCHHTQPGGAAFNLSKSIHHLSFKEQGSGR